MTFVDPASQKMLLDGIKPHLKGIAVAGVLSGAINLIARSPQDARRKRLCRWVAGQSLYLYAVAIMFQLIVYPPFAFAAWSSKRFSGDWLTQGWTSSPLGEKMRHERHFMYSLFGYMVKDMFIFINDPMFFAHHAICIVGMLCIFATPAGLGTFILGAVTLELGTFTFNVVLLCGKDAPDDVPPSVKHFAECLYGFGMPLTNLVGVALWMSFASQEGLRGTLWVWGFGACWTALIVGEVCWCSSSGSSAVKMTTPGCVV